MITIKRQGQGTALLPKEDAMDESLHQKTAQWRHAAAQAGELASGALYLAGQTAAKAACLTRQSVQAAALRRSIDAALQDLGQLLYDTHTGHPRDSEVLLAKMEEIDGLKSRLRALERQRRPACPACGGPCAPEDRFCRHCGGKLS